MSLALQGIKIWLCVFGCRSNLYEGEALANALTSRGASVTDELEGADAAVIVSCSVTTAADKKCRQAVRRARREFDGESGGQKIVAVCGCWAQNLDADEARNMGIDILVGNRLKHCLPDALENAIKRDSQGAMPLGKVNSGAAGREGRLGGRGAGRSPADIRTDLGAGRLWDALSLERPLLRTRAFLKVQDGCDHFCSYCVIPFLRGRSTSRPPDDILSEAGRVVDNGCGEIVLTGIHLGMYGRDPKALSNGTSLAELIRKLSSIPGLARLRLGSLEPFTLDGPLLRALADSPVFCRHLHLPMQSGDDGVLARMRRGHGAEDFLRVCEAAREALGGDLHISTDVMAAFPGESAAAFENTLSTMEKAWLGRVHVFPYSPRKGTEAAGFPGRVPAADASARVRAAMELGESLLNRYASRFVGRTLSVLIEEGRGKNSFSGYTKNFVAAEIRSETELEAGREVEARITECSGGKLFGVKI